MFPAPWYFPRPVRCAISPGTSLTPLSGSWRRWCYGLGPRGGEGSTERLRNGLLLHFGQQVAVTPAAFVVLILLLAQAPREGGFASNGEGPRRREIEMLRS